MSSSNPLLLWIVHSSNWSKLHSTISNEVAGQWRPSKRPPWPYRVVISVGRSLLYRAWTWCEGWSRIVCRNTDDLRGCCRR